MSGLEVPVAFSSNGEYFAYSSSDGRLKIWETATNFLKQEYTPTSHLSATCSCLTWCSTKHSYNSPRKRKKLKSDVQDVVAVGTVSGSILLYSVTLGDLHSQFNDGHSDVVNGISSLNGSSSLFSCSNDAHIVEWDIKTSKVKHKWKADKGRIHSVCVLDSKNLLSASSAIKWWDLEKQQVLKTFTGHSTEVLRLIPVLDEESTDGSYFVSAALNDRLINAWQLKQDEGSCSLASFMPSEEPVHVDLSAKTTNDQPILLSVVTQSGVLHLFEHHLNGRRRQPLAPKATIRIGTDGNKKETIPILGAQVRGGTEFDVLLVYGSFHKPMFEHISYKECKVEEVLIRKEMSHQTSILEERAIAKIKQPNVSGPVQQLAPGHMTPTAPTLVEESLRKTRRKNQVNNQLPMEVRLNALKIASKDERPTSNNLVHLLLQGLQSEDKRLLNSVLHKDDLALIHNTVQHLPIASIVPLLKELYQRLHGRGLGSYLLWTKGVLSAHTSYLTSCQEVDMLLGPLAQLIEARTEAYCKISQLKGRLELMLSQLSKKENSSDTTENALLTYQETSSDEEQIDDFEASVADSEEDLSDMDVEDRQWKDHTSSSEDDEDM